MKLLSGNEKINCGGKDTGKTLLDFWQWNSSDLLNNTLRGAFAEFIVSSALDVDTSETHIDWEAYDIHGNNGERIEVKCSAYLQSWFPKDNPNRLSNIVFSISPALEWLPDECRYKPNSCKRHSDLYVFCHYKSKERLPENPLDMNNWDFYVIATYKIDEIFGERKSLPLNILLKRAEPILCSYDGLKEAVAKEYSDHIKHLQGENNNG